MLWSRCFKKGYNFGNVQQEEKTNVQYALGSIAIIIGFLVFFAGMILYDGLSNALSFEKQTEKSNLIHSIRLSSTVEGKIFDVNGNLLNDTVNANPGEMAPLYNSELFGWAIGYSYQGGTTGLRKACPELREPVGNTKQGHSIKVTIDSRMQIAAQSILSDFNEGSVFVIENETGAIRAWASKSPINFDVNNIADTLSNASEVEESLYPRGIYETDAPGSTAKLLTMVAALSDGGFEDEPYFDVGAYDVDDKTISNYNGNAYGALTLTDAFTKSVNTYFANLAIEKIGADKMTDIYNDFLIGQDIKLDFTTLKSSYGGNEIFDSYCLAGCGFGQGSLYITPLQIAMIYQSIVSNGNMMKPYLIQSRETDKVGVGKIFSSTSWDTTQPVVLAHTTSSEISQKAKEIMNAAAISYGFTEENLSALPENQRLVYAKTGTAETARGTNHIYLIAANEVYTFIISINNTSDTSGILKSYMLNLILTVGRIT